MKFINEIYQVGGYIYKSYGVRQVKGHFFQDDLLRNKANFDMINKWRSFEP